jgi:hypothetical protein
VTAPSYINHSQRKGRVKHLDSIQRIQSRSGITRFFANSQSETKRSRSKRTVKKISIFGDSTESPNIYGVRTESN